MNGIIYPALPQRPAKNSFSPAESPAAMTFFSMGDAAKK